MLNLIWYYLIIILILFAINFGLLLDVAKLNFKKSITFSVIYSILIFIMSVIALNYGSLLTFFSKIIPYVLFTVGLILLILIMFYLYKWNKNEVKAKINSLILLITIICQFTLIFSLVAIWNPQSSIFFNSGIVSIIFLIISILSSWILKNAIKQIPGGISEFIILESILVMIFGLTFNCVKGLNYEDFTPFTILTPTYEVIMLIIGIISLIIVGVFLNDYSLKKNQ